MAFARLFPVKDHELERSVQCGDKLREFGGGSNVSPALLTSILPATVGESGTTTLLSSRSKRAGGGRIGQNQRSFLLAQDEVMDRVHRIVELLDDPQID